MVYSCYISLPSSAKQQREMTKFISKNAILVPLRCTTSKSAQREYPRGYSSKQQNIVHRNDTLFTEIPPPRLPRLSGGNGNMAVELCFHNAAFLQEGLGQYRFAKLAGIFAGLVTLTLTERNWARALKTFAIPLGGNSWW